MQLVKYPVQAADQMNRKFLNAQLARHGKVDWEQSDAAFDSIASLTRRYNALQNGKWIHMMDFQPLANKTSFSAYCKILLIQGYPEKKE